MGCRICGDLQSSYRDRSRMYLCDSCHATTPSKVDREEFERVYWDGESDTVPATTRREFWEDYKTSTYHTVEEYRKATETPDPFATIY